MNEIVKTANSDSNLDETEYMYHFNITYVS